MRLRQVVSFVTVVAFCACGSGGSSGSSSLTYSQTVTTYASEGLNSSATGKSLSDAYNDLLLQSISSTTDPTTTDAKLKAFVDAYNTYNTHIENLQSYAGTTYGISTSSDIAATTLGLKAPGTISNTSGQTIKDLNDKLQAKKAECDTILSNYNSLTDLVQKAEALRLYNLCAVDLQAMAAKEGFKITVVKAAGGIAGAAAVKGVLTYVGVAGIYFIGGATVTVSAPAAAVVILVATIGGGIIGSKAAGAIYDYCTSGSGTDSKGMAVAKGVTSGEYCAVSSTSGVTGSPMTVVAAPGTGNLQVFVDGYAPVSISGVAITQGQTVTVNVTLVPLTDVTDSSSGTISDANSQTTNSSSTSTASTCADIGSVIASSSPTDPSAGQTVSVTATLVPAISGCSVSYSVAGTDGYAASGTPTSDTSGQISFTIPGGAENVHDVVNISESSSGVETTLAYTF